MKIHAFLVRSAVSTLLTFFFFAAITSAQSNLASVSGVITDAQGGVVPLAKVVATDTKTGVQTSVTSNSAGFYHLQNLIIGSYQISVEHEGFRKYIREAVILTTGQDLGLDVKLEVGATGQAITVSSDATPIETRTSDVNTL